MTGLQKGELVDIHIKGARVTMAIPDGERWLTAKLDSYTIGLPLAAEGVTVERVAPPEWPPQVGDLWRIEPNGLYFAVDQRDIAETNTPDIVMVYAFEDYRVSPEELRTGCNGRLKLVHREELETEDEPCGCDHHGDHAGCDRDCGCWS